MVGSANIINARLSATSYAIVFDVMNHVKYLFRVVIIALDCVENFALHFAVYATKNNWRNLFFLAMKRMKMRGIIYRVFLLNKKMKSF